MIEVSVIIVYRNEERYIIDCIRSIEEQFVQSNIAWELILVDGESTDNGTQLINEYMKDKSIPFQIINNQKRFLAAGWNLGIKVAKGKYVLRPDAHAKLHPNYISNGLETLKSKPDVTAVGGLLETKANGFWGQIIKVALSSRVGVGNSSFRTATKSDYSDTAVYAIYRKEIFEKTGYFDEDLVRHQDNNMHKRIKNAGGLFYMNVDMKADYFARDSVRKLLRQMFLIGYYLPDVMGDGAVGLRHLAPFAFYLVLLINCILYFLSIPYFGYLILLQFGLYLLAISVDSFGKVISKKNPALLFNIAIIPLMHLFYGGGTFMGLIRKSFKKKAID